MPFLNDELNSCASGFDISLPISFKTIGNILSGPGVLLILSFLVILSTLLSFIIILLNTLSSFTCEIVGVGKKLFPMVKTETK